MGEGVCVCVMYIPPGKVSGTTPVFTIPSWFVGSGLGLIQQTEWNSGIVGQGLSAQLLSSCVFCRNVGKDEFYKDNPDQGSSLE